jgi:hypothetical protein
MELKQVENAHGTAIFRFALSRVLNASVWEYYKSFASIDSVTFCVLAPPNDQAFCDRYRINSNWEMSGWCQPFIVRETMKALDAVCALFPPEMRVTINLVSGNDIPVKSYLFLFRDRVYESVGDMSQCFSLTIEHAREICQTIKLNDWFGLNLSIEHNYGCPDEYMIWNAMKRP